MSESFAFRELVQDIDLRRYGEPTVGVLLTGSFARGNATPQSDVDLIVSSADIHVDDQRIFSHCGRLVVLKIQSRETLAAVLVDPRSACRYLTGLIHAVPLVDQDGFLRDLLHSAKNFEWTGEMINRAHRQAASELIGWLEEVHKGVTGFELEDSGRMLQAAHGCSWGMLRVAQLHFRVLEGSDNTVVDDVTSAAGSASKWSKLLRAAIGLTEARLPVRVLAGLELFCATVEFSLPTFLGDETQMIEPSLEVVEKFLASHSRR